MSTWNQNHNYSKMGLENVTTICQRLNQYPDLKNYLGKLVGNCKIEVKSVHKSFLYPICIVEKKLYSFYGIFIDYFIRRYLSEKLKIVFKDTRAEFYHKCLQHHYHDGLNYEIILDKNEVGDFEERDDVSIMDFEEMETGQVKLIYQINRPEVFRHLRENQIIPNFEESYIKVIDTNTYRTMDIVKDIFSISNAHLVWFDQDVINESLEYNEENLLCVGKYLDELFASSNEVLLNPAVGGKYFKGDCDLIIDNIIIDIKNSKNEKKSVKDFFQLIMYSYGAFDVLEKNIKQFKIYNPLLGKEYIILCDNINYEEFGQALKCCTLDGVPVSKKRKV